MGEPMETTRKICNADPMVDWRMRLPRPVCEDVPDYDKLYQKAWELAHDHVRHIEGMPKTP